MPDTVANSYYGVTAAIYYRDVGGTIPRHQHPFEHTTQVIVGRSRVDVFGKTPQSFEMDFTSAPFVLVANVDHQITALEDGTVILNVTPNTPMMAAVKSAAGAAGGVMLECGDIVPTPVPVQVTVCAT